MRSIPFKTVFDRVVRWHGRDSRQPISSDLSNALVDHINERVRTICQCWRWPEWEITEERAFRQIWNGTHQYYRANPLDNLPDEVFYLGSGYTTGDDEFGDGYGYYRVIASSLTDPVIGNVPTDTLYWEGITPLDSYIAYDQQCRRSIGIVRGIYSGNPRIPTCNSNSPMRYTPSEKGLNVCCSGVPTVFITHTLPAPRYTTTPWVVGKTYVRGDVVFDPTTGECFQSVSTTTDVVTDASNWNWIPFPDKWAAYVCNGAFADSLMEFDQGGNAELQAKMVLYQAATDRADYALQSEVDLLTVQGQTLQYNFCKAHSCMCESEQWAPSTLVTIT